MKGYPKWFIKALALVTLLVFITGGLLAPTTLVLRAEIDMVRLPGSARVLSAALHAAGGFLMALFIGALWSVHMRSGWRRRRQRASGLLLGLMLTLLMVSAVGIYYLGEETLGNAAAFIHLGTGVALAGPFGWHWVRGRRARRQTQAHHAQAQAHRASGRHKGTQAPVSSHRPTHKAKPTA
ncbi:MAG: hypothetical protein EOP38_12075 [Rubrivivax sp.]|nr:MAG: hypothetical protein EOP38_12075 [Rubrivivax sp.]